MGIKWGTDVTVTMFVWTERIELEERLTSFAKPGATNTTYMRDNCP